MKRFLIAVGVCILVTSEAGAAVVQGKVNFLTKRGQRPVITETLVWLDAPAQVERKAGANFTMTTRSKTFLPHIVAVPAGSTIGFPNEDPIAHNLFSLTPGNAFDLGLYRRGAGRRQKFDAPGVVNVYCNIHPNMSAVVHVMATPFFTFADDGGSYSFDVPAGKYRLNAWNEVGGSAATDIEVTPGGAVRGSPSLTIDGRSYRFVQHSNKHGQRYRVPRDY